jgi:hypothetical protein
MIPEPIILKTDGLGRVRTPLAQREALVDSFERSGLSGMKFAALHGVKYPSFANWVQQRKRRRLRAHAVGEGHPSTPQDHPAGGSGAPLQWWEAVVSEETSGGSGPEPMAGAMQLHLPGGVRMEITAAGQVAWAAQLLRSLTTEVPSRASNRQSPHSC